jgi:hypothetical protein
MATARIWVFLASMLILGACATMVDFGLRNANYELYDTRIEGLSFVLMEVVLPGYVSHDPAYRYMVHFLDNDVCTGDYYAADTLNYSVEGEWRLIDDETLFIHLDEYVNGTFHMEKLDKNTFLLSTDQNIINFIETDTVSLEMRIRRSF